MSLEPPFQLKQTNGRPPPRVRPSPLTICTVSRPQLSHSTSQQSIAASQAASEGYYSLSEHTSSEGEAQKPRYHTPPSQVPTPQRSHELLHPHPEHPITSLKGVGVPRHHTPQAQLPADDHPQLPNRSPFADDAAIDQPATKLQQRAEMDSDSVATTPGMDSTPYIRFAIDQLTRDEEVRGSRMYPLGHEDDYVEDEGEEDDYPVERIVSDESLGYMAREEQTQRRLSRYAPQRQSRHAPDRSRDAMPPAPPRQPRTPAQAQKDVFVAQSVPHTPLDFLPAILRPVWLLLFTFLCVLMLVALIFCAAYSNRSKGIGLWDYVSFGDNRYFVFEYLPALLGGALLLWLFQIQIALQRMMPFISLASEQYHQRSEAIFLQLYPMQFLCPRLEYFRAGQPLVGFCFLVFWLFSWTIPLLASSFNVRYHVDSRAWRWIAVQGVIWTTITLYILLIMALTALLVFLRRQTGLKWDPRSLADIITLLERSNIVGDYTGAETFTKQDWECLRGRGDRIGYWSTSKRPTDIFHGIGEEGAPARRYSIEDGRIREKGAERGPDPTTTEPRRAGDFSIRMDVRDRTVRLRYLPWYLRDSSVLAWIVTALVLLIAFFVVSFVNSAVRLGFLPQVNARTNAAGFSASNFLYSFVPSLLGHFLFLVILTFDYSFRTLRPYISLASKGGATAEASLLIDYACRLPLSVTFSALENQHYQTAILSLVSLCSVAIPILAGGCFWTQYYPNSDIVRVAADLPGYYALCFFLALYAVSLFALWPGRRRAALPHRSNSLGEIISWVYQSPILTDRAFNRPKTKPELVARLMGSAYLERTWAQSLTSLIRPSRDNLRTTPAVKGKDCSEKDDAEVRISVAEPGKIRYGFGIHVGRDGLEHLGIDRVRRGGDRSGRELVIWEEQNRKSWVGSLA